MCSLSRHSDSSIVLVAFARGAQLNAKIASLADAFNEQSEEVQMLKHDLKFYQRREPLVHVLWAEISRLREQVGEAVTQVRPV